MIQAPKLQLFGLDIFCLRKKFLVYNLVGRNLKIRYKRSALGLLWTLLIPLATSLVYYFVFQIILKVQIPNYLVIIVSGILPWNFFIQSVLEGLVSIVDNQELVSKVPIPIQVFPFVVAVTSFINYVLSLPVLIGIALINGVPLNGSLLFLGYYSILLLLIGYSIGLMAAIAFVYLRDLRHLAGITLQLLFYGTPVMYVSEMVPASYQWILWINPIAFIFSGIHKVVAEAQWPTAELIWIPLLWSLLLLTSSTLFLKYFQRRVVERI